MPEKVYFLPVEDGLAAGAQAQAMAKIFDAASAQKIIAKDDFVAIKMHVGEALHGTTYLKPEIVREVVQKVHTYGGQPFLTETSTLYRGERENAVKHLLHAHKRGFGIDNVGAPFIMADGLTGNAEYEVEIGGELNAKVKIAREIIAADALFVISHATGHMLTGVGACIKNLGMGFASRMGKMRQHSAMKPRIKASSCKFCQKCLKW